MDVNYNHHSAEQASNCSGIKLRQTCSPQWSTGTFRQHKFTLEPSTKLEDLLSINSLRSKPYVPSINFSTHNSTKPHIH